MDAQAGQERRGASSTVDLRVRRARRADVPAIVAMLADDSLGAVREQLADPLPEAYWRAFDAIDGDPRNRLLVAERDGAVVGTLQLTFLPGLSRVGAERCLVENVRIARPHRGVGLGRALMDNAIAEARARGCVLIELTSNRDRTDAIRFYEALGFRDSHAGLKMPLR